MRLNQEYTQELEPRLKKLAWFMLIGIGLILGRLYYLQGIRGKFYTLFSEENSVRQMPVPALRGKMMDRHGESLVDNRAAFDLVLIPQYVVDAKSVFATLQRNLNLPEELLRMQWEKRKKQAAYQPIPLLEDVSMDIASWVKAHKSPWGVLREDIDLRGVEMRLRYEREYPDQDIASHVLGYVREIDREKLAALEKKFPERYHRGDPVGVSGLEEIWDERIRGFDGYSQKVVNAVGREIVSPGLEDDLQEREPKHGAYLRLTLDARLHRVARDYFKEKKGAAVAIDPKSGAVLLLFSAPSFDLNQLGGEEGTNYWQKIASHPSRILLNRAIQGSYPPGSTYKIVTGLAALQERVVKPHDRLYCDGGLNFGNRRFHCWKEEGHGEVDFYSALVRSCDVYFYQMGLRVGVDRLAHYAKALGLGAPTGIALPNEKRGLIPTAAWKKHVFKEPWQEGETLSIAIGQGYDSVTPMQAAIMIAIVANGGKPLYPYLVESLLDPYTGEEDRVDRKMEAKSVFSEEALKLVQRGLVGVVSEPGGTAHHLSALKVPMGGKTGTAQVVSLNAACGGSHCEDHAWFVAFAPPEDPQIAVSVLVENGGHGSSAAAPLAGQLIQTYLEKRDETKNIGKL